MQAETIYISIVFTEDAGIMLGNMGIQIAAIYLHDSSHEIIKVLANKEIGSERRGLGRQGGFNGYRIQRLSNTALSSYLVFYNAFLRTV